MKNLTEKELYIKALELKKENNLLKKQNKELLRFSTIDQLTQLFNRHKIESELENECQRAIRYDRPFSVILLDLDNFKLINDSFGHQIGDTILRDVSKLLKKVVRKTDLVGRWGGEEFLILCPETNFEGSIDLAQKICKLISDYGFEKKISCTISAGCTEFFKEEDKEDLFRRVDNNLYKAKADGRNRVVGDVLNQINPIPYLLK